MKDRKLDFINNLQKNKEENVQLFKKVSNFEASFIRLNVKLRKKRKENIVMKVKFFIFAIATLMLTSVDAFSQCKGKCRNGKGVYTFEDGEVYDGQFVDGMFDGKGIYTYNSGAKYTGEFKAGKRHGKGTYVYPTGDIYTGDFVDGLPSGQGTYSFANGDRYEGEFLEGKRNGQGVYIFSSGTKQTGIFENSYMIEEISIERPKKK